MKNFLTCKEFAAYLGFALEASNPSVLNQKDQVTSPLRNLSTKEDTDACPSPAGIKTLIPETKDIRLQPPETYEDETTDDAQKKKKVKSKKATEDHDFIKNKKQSEVSISDPDVLQIPPPNSFNAKDNRVSASPSTFDKKKFERDQKFLHKLRNS